jgi:hypothetical protein
MSESNQSTTLTAAIAKVKTSQELVNNAAEVAKREVLKQELAGRVAKINTRVADTARTIGKALARGIISDASGYLLEGSTAMANKKLWSDAVTTLDKAKAEKFVTEVELWTDRVNREIHALWVRECNQVIASIQNYASTALLFNPSRDSQDWESQVQLMYRREGDFVAIDSVPDRRWNSLLEELSRIKAEVEEIGEIPSHVTDFLKRLERGSLTLAEYEGDDFSETRKWILKNPETLGRLTIKWGR